MSHLYDLDPPTNIILLKCNDYCNNFLNSVGNREMASWIEKEGRGGGGRSRLPSVLVESKSGRRRRRISWRRKRDSETPSINAAFPFLRHIFLLQISDSKPSNSPLAPTSPVILLNVVVIPHFQLKIPGGVFFYSILISQWEIQFLGHVGLS